MIQLATALLPAAPTLPSAPGAVLSTTSDFALALAQLSASTESVAPGPAVPPTPSAKPASEPLLPPQVADPAQALAAVAAEASRQATAAAGTNLPVAKASADPTPPAGDVAACAPAPLALVAVDASEVVLLAPAPAAAPPAPAPSAPVLVSVPEQPSVLAGNVAPAVATLDQPPSGGETKRTEVSASKHRSSGATATPGKHRSEAAVTGDPPVREEAKQKRVRAELPDSVVVAPVPLPTVPAVAPPLPVGEQAARELPLPVDTAPARSEPTAIELRRGSDATAGAAQPLTSTGSAPVAVPAAPIVGSPAPARLPATSARVEQPVSAERLRDVSSGAATQPALSIEAATAPLAPAEAPLVATPTGRTIHADLARPATKIGAEHQLLPRRDANAGAAPAAPAIPSPATIVPAAPATPFAIAPAPLVLAPDIARPVADVPIAAAADRVVGTLTPSPSVIVSEQTARPAFELRPASAPVTPLRAAAPAAAPIRLPEQPAAQAFAAQLFAAAAPPQADDGADPLAELSAAFPLAGLTGAAIGPELVSAPVAIQDAALDMTDDSWMSGMIERIETLRDAGGSSETRIRLSPDALGGVDVAITLDESGALQVQLTTETPQARAMLAEAAPRLADLAEARGLKLGGSAVDAGAGNAGGERRDPNQSAPARPRPAGAHADAHTHTTDHRIA